MCPNGVGFYNSCAVWGTWNVYQVIWRLYWWVCKTLRLSQLVVEHSVVVMSARLNSMGSEFFIVVSWNLFSELVGDGRCIKIWASWGLQHFKIPAGILVKAISMTHSDMLDQLDIFTFCFYEPLLFQIFVS